MVCGNFRESNCRGISLDDIEAERLMQLLRLACGKEGIVADNVEEWVELGELAERLQMEAVRSEIEFGLFEELKVENCLEIMQRSEGRGLDFLQKECYKMLCDEFEVISQKESFLKLSEEMMGTLLEDDQLKVNREEDVFEAVVRWMSNSDEGLRGMGLLSKIRYGVISNEYLAGYMASALMPWHGMLKELVGEVMARIGGVDSEGMWDGVERLCGKWMVARGMKGRVIGAGVLKCPNYIAMDGRGRTIVSDSELHEIIVFSHDGSVLRRFGSKGAAVGQFNVPMGVAADRQSHIVVADCDNHRIQVLNEDGSVARCFGSEGTAVGQFDGPWGVAIDREGHIVVADRGNNRIQVFDAGGSVVRHFGSYGTAIGQLNGPTGVAVDRAGRVAVAEWGNHRVQVFKGDGSVALCFGSDGDGSGQLKHPEGVAVDSTGGFVVADTGNHRIQVFNPDGSVARVMGSAGDGVGQLCEPFSVVLDGAGLIFVTECGNNHRVQVF